LPGRAENLSTDGPLFGTVRGRAGKQVEVDMRALWLIAAGMALVAQPVLAGQIEAACLKSDRSYGQRAICRCIQNAADLTLSNRDQRLAATFFEDPHRAQEVRQSDSRRHERFWERYKNFGRTAEVYCRR
jgi:hypothetical protein